MRRLTIAVSLTVLLSSLAAARDWNLEFLDYRYLSGSYYDLDIAEGYLWMAAKRGSKSTTLRIPRRPSWSPPCLPPAWPTGSSTRTACSTWAMCTTSSSWT